MARARNIKPSIFKNELLGEADPFITILFSGLWCLADREGRLEDRPKRIKAEIFPYREELDVNGYLTELQRMGFIQRYEAENVPCIQVLNFKKHQSPHKTEKPSELPEMPTKTVSCSLTEQTPLNNGTSTVKESLIPDSLIPDSKSIKGKKKSLSKKVILPEWIPKHLWDEWMVVRKKKKAVDSPTAITALINNLEEITANGYTAEYAITKAIEKSWKSVELDWLNNLKNQNGGGNGKPSKLDEAIESINRYRPV